LKRVLLGLGNEKFNKIIRQALEPHFEVIKEEVLSHKYLEELIEEQNPDIIIVHDYFLPSEKTHPFEREVEWLQTIERIRRAYDDSKRIVFICERKQGDPFLSELVNRNVLDIFHNRNLDIQTMIKQLIDQPRYSKVAYLKVEGSSKKYNQHVYEPFSGIEIINQTEETNETSITLQQEKEESRKSKGFPKFSLPKISLPSFTIKKDKEKEKEEVAAKEEAETELKKEPEVAKQQKIEPEKVSKEFNESNDTEISNTEGKPKKLLFSNLFQGGTKEKEKEKEQDILSTIRPRLIAVGSITPGAGSTFFLHNFTRYLSDQGVSCGILEAINDTDALLALSISESPPEFDWESPHNLVQEGANYLYNLQKWHIERTMVIPTHNLNKESFTKEHAKELIYYARQNPLLFVDISHDWTDPISKEALGLCDELWCIAEPNPMYIEVQRKHHQQLYQVSHRIGEENIIVIGNKWGDGVDMERFPEIFITIPYIPENPKALSNNKPVYRLKPKAFAGFSKLYARLNKSVV
jgi:hypothetical protein